jgi:hypothetical protein
MLEACSYLLQLVGLILLVIGYRTSNRNLLLAAALILWIGSAVPDLVQGFNEGWRSVR